MNYFGQKYVKYLSPFLCNTLLVSKNGTLCAQYIYLHICTSYVRRTLQFKKLKLNFGVTQPQTLKLPALSAILEGYI